MGKRTFRNKKTLLESFAEFSSSLCEYHLQHSQTEYLTRRKKKQEQKSLIKQTLDINKPFKILLCLCIRFYTYKGQLSTTQGLYRGTKDSSLNPITIFT